MHRIEFRELSNMSTMQNASMEAMNVAAKLPTPLAAMYSEKLKPSVKTLPKEMLKEITEGLDDVRELALNIACIESVDRQKAECIIKHCAADDTQKTAPLIFFL